MTQQNSREKLRLYSTCPPSNGSGVQIAEYRERVRRIATQSEAAGYEGILVYTDNGIVDPWLVSQFIIENTERLAPLVAVQPVYMHPYSVAKMITTLGNLHGRKVYLNMVAGGFKNDLLALGDRTPHDERYDRLVEYTAVIRTLLEADGAASLSGKYYNINNLRLTPQLDADLLPGYFVSGSSEAGMDAARLLRATAVQYPKPPHEYENGTDLSAMDVGVRIGVITRENSGEAWRLARERFPEDRKGQITHQVAMRVSDSVWHKQLSELGKQPPSDEHPYWLVPFENYKTFCPYLVGDHTRVAGELSHYIELGYRTFILDVPFSTEDLEHTGIAFEQALHRIPA